MAAASSRTKRATDSSSPDSAERSGTKNGLGRKRTSSTMSDSAGMPVLEPEREQRDREIPLPSAVALLDQRPQHVHSQPARVDQGVGLAAQIGQRLPLGGDAGPDVGVRQRVPPPGLGKTADEDLVGGLEKEHLDGVPRLAQVRRTRGTPTRKLPPRASSPSAARSMSVRCRRAR